VEIKGQVWKGMMNIGNNPSITSKNRSIEVHIFDFDTDIYDEDIIVRFIKRIREEISFDNLQALKNQLENDKDTALGILT
jgi:riboflavin kinase/FMN adenylyltransferase